jgi:hypothetical protein
MSVQLCFLNIGLNNFCRRFREMVFPKKRIEMDFESLQKFRNISTSVKCPLIF